MDPDLVPGFDGGFGVAPFVRILMSLVLSRVSKSEVSLGRFAWISMFGWGGIAAVGIVGIACCWSGIWGCIGIIGCGGMMGCGGMIGGCCWIG